jgi:hypothetical protein
MAEGPSSFIQTFAEGRAARGLARPKLAKQGVFDNFIAAAGG